MNNLMIFENKPVEVFEWNGKILFNPKNVAECLDIKNVNENLRSFNENQVMKLTNSKISNTDFRKLHNTGENFLTESGVYKLIFKSKKAEAEKFQDWVTDEVLPSIRKTGSYNSNGIIKQLIEQLNNTNLRLKELENIVYKKQRQSIANRKHYLKLNEPLEVRLDRITSDMINQIIVNSIVDGILRRTEEGIVVDKNVLFFEASKFNIKKHDIKKKLELLNKIIYKQVRINGKNMWCIVINK